MSEFLSLGGPLVCTGIMVVVAIIFAGVRIVQEYERGVIFRLGRVMGAKGPGIFFVIPIIDKMVKVDLRTITLDVPTQEAITSDNVCLLYTSPSPRDKRQSRMPSSA